MNIKTKRIHWIDQWRGLAVLFMIFYHLAFNLNYLNIIPFNQGDTYWFFEGNFVRLTFLLIVGLSLYLSHKKYPIFLDFLRHHFSRAIKLFLIAMMITLASWFMDPSNTILFGMLHLIGVGVLCAALAVRYPFLSVLLGLLSFYMGAAFTQLHSDILFLLPLGVTPSYYQSFDYFPIFPWVGFIFFGIALAHLLNRLGLFGENLRWPRLKGLEWLGHHALIIYLVHQPILLGILWLFI